MKNVQFVILESMNTDFVHVVLAEISLLLNCRIITAVKATNNGMKIGNSGTADVPIMEMVPDVCGLTLNPT